MYYITGIVFEDSSIKVIQLKKKKYLNTVAP